MKEYTTLFPFQDSNILTTTKIGNRKPNISGDLNGFENIRSTGGQLIEFHLTFSLD